MRVLSKIGWLNAFGCLVTFCLVTGLAQTPPHTTCDATILDADGYQIRRVELEARYASITLPPPGTPFTRELESKLLRAVNDAFKQESQRDEGSTLYQLAGATATKVEARLITSCLRPLSAAECQAAVGQDKCLDLTIQAKSLRLSPDSLGQNLLSALPRSNRQTFVTNVPAPLLALNPQFGATADRGFGLAETVSLSTDLLSLKENLRGDLIPLRNDRLDVRAQGRKSLSQPFYETAVGLSYTRKLPLSSVPAISAGADFTAEHQPLGDASYLRNAITFNGQVRLTTPAPGLKRLDLNAGFRRASQRLFKPTATAELTSEQAGYFNALLSGQIKQDFWRAGVWYEQGSPESFNGNYQRAAGLVGYAKEFGKGNQTVGLEVLAGAGRAWGMLPRYAQFFGGNTAQNFLYDGEAARYLNTFPTGPVLRSFGNAQLRTPGDAAVRGASSYAHVNVSVALPIPKWSRPLIPDEVIEDDDGTGAGPVKLRQVIKGQAQSGEFFLRKLYKNQGIANAEEKARKEFAALNSAINFLVDRANLYAVKPLILFEAARLNLSGSPADRTRFGIGAGVQFTVTIAKFEAGYVFATRRRFEEPRGNFTLRLYFQNLF